MGWDDRSGRTVVQRLKEESDDYRYFPEPDLPPLRLSRAWVDEIQAMLPELPDARRDRFIADCELPPREATVLAADREVADYFEVAVAAGRQQGITPKMVSPWVTGELFRLLNAQGIGIAEARIEPTALAELVALVQNGTITAGSGKAVLGEMFSTGRPAGQLVREKGLAQISDEEALSQVVDQILAEYPEQVAKYREGKETLLQWFVGQVMRATRGKANAQIVTSLLQERLKP
jgi:aspartyl-tRNA(Asn)/glutamyl-tRNA(Gln) amidotransferase subunit B